MDDQGREGYSGGTMTTGSVRESAVTGRWVTTTSGTNTIWRVYDGNGGSLPSSVLGLRYLFQGREYSWAIHAATGGTGLYNFRARWYDPVTGRWLSNDPIGISGGMNQYAFCANNPVMFVDPEGLRFGNMTSTVVYVKPENSNDGLAVPVEPGKVYDGPIDGFSVSTVPGKVYKVADGQDVGLVEDRNGYWVVTRGSYVELMRSGSIMKFVRNLLGPSVIRWFADGERDQCWIDNPKDPKPDWQPLLDKSYGR